MATPDDFVGALRGLELSEKGDAHFKVLAEWSRDEFARARKLDGAAPGFASLIARMEPSDAVTLLVRTNSMGVWIDRARDLAAKHPSSDPSQAARDARVSRAIHASMLDAIDRAATKVAQRWPDPPASGTDLRRDNVLRAMASLLRNASDAGHRDLDGLRERFASAVYPRGASRDAAAVSDRAMEKIFAAQAAPTDGSRAPFSFGVDANDFAASLAARRPGLDQTITLAMASAVAASNRAGADITGGDRLRAWRDGQGRLARDPFEGPAVIREHADGRTEAVFVWEGRRLAAPSADTNSTLQAALESFADDHPAEFVARHLAEGTDPASLPPALREILESKAAVRLAA
jgi:hypothetical protein